MSDGMPVVIIMIGLLISACAANPRLLVLVLASVLGMAGLVYVLPLAVAQIPLDYLVIALGGLFLGAGLTVFLLRKA